MSWGTMVIITKKESLTEKEIDDAVYKYTYYAKVPEHAYGTIEKFRDDFNNSKRALEHYGAERFSEMYPHISPETLANDNLAKYVEENSRNIYKVKGNIAYSTINDINFLFDAWAMPEPVEQYFLFTKDKKKVACCKTTDWDLIGKGATIFDGITIDDNGNKKVAGRERAVERMVYDLIYDYDNDTIEGINYFNASDEECDDWDNNFDKHAAKYVGEDTYAYIIKYHF